MWLRGAALLRPFASGQQLQQPLVSLTQLLHVHLHCLAPCVYRRALPPSSGGLGELSEVFSYSPMLLKICKSTFCIAAAEAVSHRCGGMEGSRNPGATPAVQNASSSAVPLHSDHETDSFLTAARLLRGGWLEEGNKTKRQFVYSHSPVGHPSRSTSGQHLVLNSVKTCLSGSRTGLVLVTNSKKMAEDQETGSERKTGEDEPTPAGTLSTRRHAERRAGVLWTSGCRSTCQQIRRVKAPLLPAIAEI